MWETLHRNFHIGYNRGCRQFVSEFELRVPVDFLPKSERSCGLLRSIGSKVLATKGNDPVVALFIFKIQPLLNDLWVLWRVVRQGISGVFNFNWYVNQIFIEWICLGHTRGELILGLIQGFMNSLSISLVILIRWCDKLAIWSSPSKLIWKCK